MRTVYDLAALRETIMLLEGEMMLEGWAAARGTGGGRVLGLLMVTNLRVVFVDVEGRFTAFPISKVDYVENTSPSQVTLTVWYDRMNLTFDDRSAAGAVLNLLRQDLCWNAAEVTLAHQALDIGEGCCVRRNSARRAANDIQPDAGLAKAS